MKGFKFDGNGLLTGIAQDSTSNQILMVAMMNREAINLTLETGLEMSSVVASRLDALVNKAIECLAELGFSAKPTVQH